MLSVHSALTMDKNSEMLNKTQRFIKTSITFYCIVVFVYESFNGMRIMIMIHQ